MKNQSSIVNRQSSLRRGFSFVELLIVMAIVLVMTGVLFAKQSDRKATADVEAAARQVAAQIRALQNEALSGKQVDNGGTSPVNACGYVFEGNKTTEIYKTYYYDCTGTPGDIITDGSGNNAGEISVDLSKKRVNLINSASKIEFYFQSPRGEVKTINPTSFTAGGNIEIRLQSTIDTTVDRYICVSRFVGNVIEQKTSCP